MLFERAVGGIEVGGELRLSLLTYGVTPLGQVRFSDFDSDIRILHGLDTIPSNSELRGSISDKF